MPLELDDISIRVIGTNVPISFYDDTRTLRAQIFLQADNTLNVGGTVSSGGGSGTPAGTGAHGLGDLAVHTGQLANAQAPQFLLLNGTRPLTANWDVGSYQIRAQTFQSDVSTGTAPLIVASATVVANLNADLWDGYQFADYLNQAVKTTSGPTFAALTLNGDLTVGANVLFADQSQANVGINCAPDSQFDLDVAGNLRAQGWIVGRHAIQLANAIMICHFDGPEPYATNFYGVSTGHRGQVGTEAGGVIFRPGKFGKGVQIAEAAENLQTNPSFETDTAGWFAYGTNTITRTTFVSYVGAYTGKVTYQDNTTLCRFSPTSFDASSDYFAGVHVYVPTAWDGGDISIAWEDFTDGTNGLGVTLDVSSQKGRWVRVSQQRTTGTDTAGYIRIKTASAPTAGKFIYIDGADVFKADHDLLHCDGSMGSGHTWSGTAHASTSTRTAASLTYDASMISGKNELTFLMWTTMPADHDGNWFDTTQNTLFEATGAAGYRIRFRYESDDETFSAYMGDGSDWYINSAAQTFDAGDVLHLALVLNFTDNSYQIYVNGAASGGEVTDAHGSPALTAWGVGCRAGGTGASNFIIDDYAVIEDALTADEIRAIYESDAPVFAETSTFTFRTPTASPVYADDEGFWVKDTSGNAVFGIYGAAATKSWGGVTLSPRDVLIGRSTNYLLWDDSEGELRLKSAAGNLQIDDDGIILNAATDKFSAAGILWKDGATRHLSLGVDVDLGSPVSATLEADTLDLNIRSGGNISIDSDSIYLGDNTTGSALLIGGDGAYVQFTESADPDAPAANQGRLYARDNGAGKTQLCVRFNSGAVQVIATQP